MRKATTLLLALALVLSLTQCKKNVETVGGDKIKITLDVDGGKHVINPSTSGQVGYESGDVIYVGDGSRFIGTLAHNGEKFVGEVNTPIGDKLHFYFIGGFEPSATPEQGSTTSFTVNISNQAGKLPVLSYVDVDYVPGQTAYTCVLRNKCVLVEFKLTTGTSDAVTLNSVPTIATINFSTPGITSTGTTGNITLYSVSTTSKWAILLPAAETNTNVTIGGNDYDVTVPAITANGYLHDETAIVVDNAAPAADYVFSVSSTKTVHFSPGNLQYKAGEGWRFAEHQYDVCQTTAGPWNTTGWVDFFGWGTWSKDKNPLNVSENDADYQWGDDDFQGTIDGHSDWFTLNDAQWGYILNHSTHGPSTVNGVYGRVIRPDGNTTPVASTYSAEAWAAEEASGAVFLPTAGCRYGSNVKWVVGEKYGWYWISTLYSDDYPYGLCLDPYGEAYMGGFYRSAGYSVRLVR